MQRTATASLPKERINRDGSSLILLIHRPDDSLKFDELPRLDRMLQLSQRMTLRIGQCPSTQDFQTDNLHPWSELA